MTDAEIFHVLSEMQHEVRLLRELMFYLMAMLFAAGVAAVLTPIFCRWPHQG